MSPSGEVASGARPSWPWIATAAGFALLLHTAHFDHIADDAFISLRYADHWLNGEGLVFNPGERVLGYSNFLWVVAMAGLGALGAPLVTAAQIAGVALSLACLGLVCKHVAEQTGSTLATAAAGLWLAASGPFALWAGAGLEGPLFAFALLVATLGAARLAFADSTAAGTNASMLAATCSALAAATLTRPEGAGYAVALGLWLGLRAWSSPASRARFRPALACIAAGAVSWLAFACFAALYYGDPLPNTYYAKAHPLSLELLYRAWLFSFAYLKAHAFAPLLVLLAFALTHRRRPLAAGWAAVVAIAAFGVYYARIGGDALVYYRMWAWLQPLFALLLAYAVAACQNATRGRPLAFAGVALPLLCLPNSLVGFDIDYLRADDARIRSLGELGRELRDLPGDTRIATNVIGALGFESRLYVIDMLGLTNAHIARAPGKELGTPGHESHDGAYVLDQLPDFIFVGIPRATSEPLSLQLAFQPSFPSDHDLAADARLQTDYLFQHLELPEREAAPGRRLVAAFIRRGYSGIGASSPTR